MAEEVDLIAVQDHHLAEEIVKALKHAGIPDVEFWPEHMLRPARAYSGALLVRGVFKAKRVPDAQLTAGQQDQHALIAGCEGYGAAASRRHGRPPLLRRSQAPAGGP